MLGTSYASRKTSITQLLNPLLPPSGPDHKSHPSGLPGFTSPANAPAQHYQPLQQTAAFQSQQTPQSHFGLRAANWDTTVNFNSRQGDEDEYEHRGMASPAQPQRAGTSYTAWPAFQPITNGAYQSSSVTASYSTERTTLSGNQPATSHDSVDDQLDMGYTGAHSELQPAERASTRIAARATTVDTSTDPQRQAPQIDVSSAYIPTPPSASLVSIPSQSGKGLKRSRKSAEVDEGSTSLAAGAPAEQKPKKARAKTKAVANGTTAKSKKGYTAKKRNAAAQIVANAAQMLPSVPYAHVNGKGKGKSTDVSLSFVPDETDRPFLDAHPDLKGVVYAELQYARCMSNRYKSDEFPRCVSCTRRWAGDTCRFQGIRFLVRNEKRDLIALSFVESQKGDAPSMVMPTQWNIALEAQHLDRIMRTVALSLLPHLKMEQEHVNVKSVIRRPRETEVRATCDTCMTSLFSSSWMCRQCGREACPDCYKIVRELTEDTLPMPMATMNELQVKRDKHAQTNPFFLSCTRRNEHGTAHFSPVSRFCAAELNEAVVEMEALLKQPEVFPQDPIAKEKGEAQNGDESTEGSGRPSTSAAGAIIENPLPPGVEPSGAPPVPSWPIHHFNDSELTEEIFRTRWVTGEPLVVAGLLPKFDIHWSPAYFIEKYQTQSCLILECQTDANKRVTVGDFFSWFGKYEGRTEWWKLKDWPPSTDFKTAFPELYDDFVRAVPVPTYTRRDGAMNIASHFPSNTVAPDLGPKMYNAFASTEAAGSKGSTRLHMDMADAVNIMLHSEKSPTGAPGCAAWDIFRAEDAGTIRKFLRKNFKGTYQNDPIHAQMFYLDSELRQKLYDEYSVKSWRIYQRPGEAVFIPAGCAHQVCNLADCIKVACDFVSPENIARCERLTNEFRDQNQTMVWKEDVLQLRTMMWFAWLSCRRHQKETV